MNFHEIQQELLGNFNVMCLAYGGAFRTDADKDKLWETYLESFPPERNKIFRVNREHDCSCCRHFIKEIGGIVFIDAELKTHTIWGIETGDPDYQIVFDAMDAYVKSCAITDVYLNKSASVGASR